ncbi:MAG TPA: sporulation membrane protein YtrI [Chondromyces sp.]|nr:sporulation membrane protein YtrI [Chondromyces sp.]
MRVPTLTAKSKIFLSGIAVGACLSWFLFLYMHGVLHERQAEKIERQQADIQELEAQLAIWQEEFKKINKENQKKLTVQTIKVEIVNFEKYGIEDSHSVFEAEEMIKNDLRPLLAKDLESVFYNKELIKRVIENKTLKLNDKRYRLRIIEMNFYTEVEIKLHLQLDT